MRNLCNKLSVKKMQNHFRRLKCADVWNLKCLFSHIEYLYKASVHVVLGIDYFNLELLEFSVNNVT